MNEIKKASADIERTITIQADQNPAIAYITRLGTTNSRYGMRWVLNLATSVLSNRNEPELGDAN